ncbi:MAG: hypothetical protein ABSA91_04865 [Acidimicrobiales bacterium]|jgi:hypothetical protein
MNVPRTSASRYPRLRHRLAQFVGVLAITASAGALASAPAYAAAKTVHFSGHYKGTVALLINNGAVSIPTLRGKGSGTAVGLSTVTGKGSASASAQCDPFSGTGSITGAHSKIDLFVVKSSTSGCSSGESGPVTVTFSGTAKATGGTGATKGAEGALKFKGTLDLKGTSGSQNGTYSVTLTGNLSVS